MDVLQLAFGGLHRFTQQGDCFQCVVQPFPSFAQAILEQDLWINGLTHLMGQLGGIDRNGVFHLPEQIHVIDDVAEILVIAIQPVGAANSLKQAVVLHTLVDIKIGTTRRIKACQ